MALIRSRRSETENQINPETLILFENMVIAAEINSISLTKNQIRAIIDKKSAYNK